MGTIEKNFLDDGFKVTYYDGVVERFHKNLLDDNYRGEKGSLIAGHWLDDGFTVNKFDGTKENFYPRNSKEFLGGDKGTRIRKGFWGDYFVSENPYAGYKPPTIAEARKAKYQETPIRAYAIDRNSETTLEELKNDFQDIIESAGLRMHVADVTVNGNPAVAIVSNTNTTYMPICSYFTVDKGQYMIVSTVSGKGQQTNAADLSKLSYRAASPWGKLQIKASGGGAMATHFGYSVRAGGAIGGISALAGFAIGSGFKLAAKGLKVLLRDSDAYQKEMDFYNQAAGMIDYAVGYHDSYGLQDKIKEHAEDGLPVAQYQMGLAHIYGIGVEANEDMAIKWFDQAAERGELRSQNIIAGEYLYNTEKDYSREQKERGIEYLYNLASFGEDWAGQLIIDIYGRGTVKGISLDYDEAVRVAQIYTEYDPLFSADFLAPIYDTAILSSDDVLNKYKNDELAFREYGIIAQYGEGEDREAAALKLATMAKDGRGTVQSDAAALQYYHIAADCGNVPAKAVMLHAYTNGAGIEKSKTEAERYAKEIIHSGDKEYAPEAYYSLFHFADEEERYGESMKHARQYIACECAELEKKAYLEKYLSDMDAKIATMSDAERRAFLKEPKSLTMNRKALKWILIGVAVVIAAAGLIFSIDKSRDDDYTEDNLISEAPMDYQEEEYPLGNTMSAEASSVLPDQGEYTYAAENVIDGDAGTAWVEGVSGDGIGESIRVTFDNDEPITAIYIRNGYQQSEEVFQKNGRVRDAEVRFEDGSVESFSLFDDGNENQIVVLSSEKEGNSIELTIQSVYSGTDYDDTCISEIGLARNDVEYSDATPIIYAEPENRSSADDITDDLTTKDVPDMTKGYWFPSDGGDYDKWIKHGEDSEYCIKFFGDGTAIHSDFFDTYYGDFFTWEFRDGSIYFEGNDIEWVFDSPGQRLDQDRFYVKDDPSTAYNRVFGEE